MSTTTSCTCETLNAFARNVNCLMSIIQKAIVTECSCTKLLSFPTRSCNAERFEYCLILVGYGMS